MTIAEVLHVKGKKPIPAQDRDKVEAFFRHEYIVVRGLDRGTSELARDVVWDYDIAPKDAIHVATALVAHVDRMDTTDLDLIKKSELTVGDRGPLTIAWPAWPQDPQQA